MKAQKSLNLLHLGSRGVFGWGGSVCGLGSIGLLLGVDGGTFVFDISNETVVVISSVGDDLNATVGKVDTV